MSPALYQVWSGTPSGASATDGVRARLSSSFVTSAGDDHVEPVAGADAVSMPSIGEPAGKKRRRPPAIATRSGSPASPKPETAATSGPTRPERVIERTRITNVSGPVSCL